MSFDVQVRSAAELDLAEAQLWYESQQRGLGGEFISEVSQVFDRLAENPLIYQAVHKAIRRALVHHFPFLIWYRVLGEVVTVARLHTRQTISQQGHLSLSIGRRNHKFNYRP